MSDEKTGGPAFPRDHAFDGHNGMTLRDYFAAKAPLHDLKFQSTEAAARFCGLPMPLTDDDLVVVAMSCAAKASYIFADAMLKARQQ